MWAAKHCSILFSSAQNRLCNFCCVGLARAQLPKLAIICYLLRLMIVLHIRRHISIHVRYIFVRRLQKLYIILRNFLTVEILDNDQLLNHTHDTCILCTYSIHAYYIYVICSLVPVVLK